MMDGSRLSRLIANHSRGNALAFNRGGGHQVCGSSGIEDPSANALNRLFIIGPGLAQTQSKPHDPKYMASATE